MSPRRWGPSQSSRRKQHLAKPRSCDNSIPCRRDGAQPTSPSGCQHLPAYRTLSTQDEAGTIRPQETASGAPETAPYSQRGPSRYLTHEPPPYSPLNCAGQGATGWGRVTALENVQTHRGGLPEDGGIRPSLIDSCEKGGHILWTMRRSSTRRKTDSFWSH